MGDVKDAIKGKPPKKSGAKLTDSGNVLERLDVLTEDVRDLTQKKDEDTLTEGDSEKAENMRKSGILRAALHLLRQAASILKEY